MQPVTQYRYAVTFMCNGRPFNATVNAADTQWAVKAARDELARHCSEFDRNTARVSSVVETKI